MTQRFVSSEFPAFLDTIKSRITLARTRAIRAAFHEGVILNWDIGREIVLKQQTAGWGNSVVERLAADLRLVFPNTPGFSANNLWLMRQFYTEYSTPEFLEQAFQEIAIQHPQRYLFMNPKLINQNFALIRSKGDHALFGKSTQAMKAQWNVPEARPLADFAPTIILKAKDFATEITIHNAREHQMSSERTISKEHVTNNQAVRDTLLQRGIRPESLPPAEDLKKVERRLASDEKKSLHNPEPIEG